MILIPVKNVENAKQRLAPVLSPDERSELARLMFEDVVETLAGWVCRPPVAIVTGDAEAQRLARRVSFDVIDDPANGGETEAIAMATRICEAQGVSSLLVIPGDIPLLETAELEAVLAAGVNRNAADATAGVPTAGRCSVLVPAADGRGTNAALRSPPSLFPLRFGDDSFAPHLQAARATGCPCTVLRLPSIALDVDMPADLAALLSAETRTRSQVLLRAWNIPQRLGRLALQGAACRP